MSNIRGLRGHKPVLAKGSLKADQGADRSVWKAQPYFIVRSGRAGKAEKGIGPTIAGKGRR